ncbi:hypothetical protein BCR41DRAFT_355451 [Lobosporangium transversale]|uniref:HAUS augmin-like complex subunit 6 N-terminal domain-containing protein n=1 Tax=Lobosporangium transversale TaxID=64571 RepID=A0A1Y2GLN1_9FUNG|nr:hypothetical protein BCR41DRAFT_355451 [Lobosporangium transversale]ORZ13331.1 hypothetical protein BCR41DRAFT_355451 [Lobosporangium transversale]|eukprot:XP_021880412.1 hypothetical protein BCR41DRAFT_355451 [Lobosporangium transversale]
MDRHDAREFRNVAFKWLEELRKEGSFGIGHNMDPINPSLESGQTTAKTTITGLGVFLSTIRRSYLDESIGVRIEQLILILSTYILAHVVSQEMNWKAHPQPSSLIESSSEFSLENERVMHSLVSAAPEHARDEDKLFAMVNSHILKYSQFFVQNMQLQRKIRQKWSSMSTEITNRIHVMNEELAKVEAERHTFLAYQPQFTQRTEALSLQELQILEDRWIEKINAQWKPILGFVERHTDRKEVLQSLMNAKSGEGTSVLSAEAIRPDLPLTFMHLGEGGYIEASSTRGVDPMSILKAWKRSLQVLNNSGAKYVSGSDNTTVQYTRLLQSLSEEHSEQLKCIRALKKQLNTRLENSNRKLEQLQREHTAKKQPYNRLLSTIHIDAESSETEFRTLFPSATEIRQEAALSSNQVLSILEPPVLGLSDSLARVHRIRTHVHGSAHQNQKSSDPEMRLCDAIKHSSSNILLLNASSSVQPPASIHCQLPTISRLKLASSKPAPIKLLDPRIGRTKTGLTDFILTRKQAITESMAATSASVEPSLDVVTESRSPIYTAMAKEPAFKDVITSPQSSAPMQTRSIFQERLGVSRKRRQSSETEPEQGSLLQFSTRMPVLEVGIEGGIDQQKELFSIFGTDSGGVPVTPSKKPRISMLERPLLAGQPPPAFELGLSTKGNNQPSILELTSIEPPKKPVYFPNLTLDDLRAPTPKPTKTKDATSETTMPIMFLHTPERRQLFQRQVGPPSKLELPFSALTPLSTSDSTQSRVITSPVNALSRSPLSSSIFSRFKAGSSLPSSKSWSQPKDTLNAVHPNQLVDESSPFQVITPSLECSISLGKPTLGKGSSGTMALSSVSKDLMTEDSDFHYRICSKDPWQLNSSTNDGNNSCLPSGSLIKDSLNPKVDVVTFENKQNGITTLKKTPQRTALTTTTVDLKAGINPWGRPPSWKPKSPKMVDMERRREADRSSRLATRAMRPMPSLEPLSKSMLGSLKVSVYGRSRAYASSPSPTFFSSTSSQSSKSYSSVSNIREANGSMTTVDGSPMLGKYEINNNDTRGFSPPPVSPIHTNHSEPTFFSESLASTGKHKDVLTESLFKAPAQSATIGKLMSTDAVPMSRSFILQSAMISTPTTSKGSQYLAQQLFQQGQRQVNRDQFILGDESLTYGKIEENTVLSHTLGRTFNGNDTQTEDSYDDNQDRKSLHNTTALTTRLGSNTSMLNYREDDQSEYEDAEVSIRGLFDEDMPDSLDPNESLWEEDTGFVP